MRRACAAAIACAFVPLLARAQTIAAPPDSVARAARDSTSRASSIRASARAAALQNVLRVASASNRLPADLISYKATAESEIAVILRQEEGIETVTALEGVASTLRWTRAGNYDQHVTGYRAQQLGVSISMLSFIRRGWLSPTLYGNRIWTLSNLSDPGDEPPEPARVQRKYVRRPDSVLVVHPLADDRDRFYEFSNGDTVVTLHPGGRSIPIVRVHVEPRKDVPDTMTVFVGDMDLDVSRGTLVTLRGYFAQASKARHRGLSLTIGEAISFIEFQNAEYNGKYWLPATQRLELQATFPVLGDGRVIIRIVSRFPSFAINDTVLDARTLAAADSLRSRRRRLSYAPNDSLSEFSRWEYSLGDVTAGMHSDDFNDIAPDRMRTTGAPRLEIAAPHATDVLHFDRVEGWYTGLGVKLALRDKAPGVVVRANAGWAWSEGTMRGRVSAERLRGNWGLALRAGRSLDNTNDFQSPLDSAPPIASWGSDDPFDYVDRRSASLGITRFLAGRQARLHVDFGIADDRYAATTVDRGLSRRGAFLPNRGVDEGSYRRTVASLEWHADIDAEAVRPGITGRLLYERGDGTLTYQRAEARATARQLFGPFTWVVRADAGQLFGRDLPSQQLFELGKGQNLPGYTTKEFAGTRAAVLRTNLLYTSHFFREPLRLTKRFWLPAVAPGASVGLQSGWTDAPTDAARASILRLGLLPDSTGALHPVSRVTERVRATASAGLRFFSGSLFVGMARAVDTRAKWKVLVSGGKTM